jgi:hypothetical protein
MKNLTFFFVAILLGVTVFAQVPQSFRYQAVARDNSGNVLANQGVSFKISVLSGNVMGETVYSETYTGLSTNSFGLVELEIGKGTPGVGSFSSIDWGNNNYFIKTEMDPLGGTAYQELSTNQLLSVPYSLYANQVKENDDADADPTNELQTLTVNGNDLSISDGNSVPLPKSSVTDTVGLKLSSVILDIDGFKPREILDVKYSITRLLDSYGQPTSKLKIGVISVRLKAQEDGNTDFVEWICDPFAYKDGKIIYESNDEPIKELDFKKSYLINYQEVYNINGLIEEFEILPQEIRIGNASLQEGLIK